MEEIKIRVIKEEVLGAFRYTATTIDGQFSAVRYTEKEAVDALVLKVLVHTHEPKVKVNNKIWRM